MQSADSIIHDRTTAKVAEPSSVAAEHFVLHVASPAWSDEVGRALEGRPPIVDPRERPKGSLPGRSDRVAGFARAALKTTATPLILTIAVLASAVIWDYYITAPWTQDGSIRVQVANVAPQVSGQITEIRIVDNQYVHEGDVLYVINPFDFRVALDMDKAQLREKAADLQVKRVQAERRQHLTDLSTTPEEQQLYVGNATQAQGAFDAAQQQVEQADINLKRTQVRSPVNG